MNKCTIQGEKYLWKIPEIDNVRIASIAAKHNISFAVAQVLYVRGFRDDASIGSFLFTTFEESVVHSSHMKDAQKAVDRILYAIDNNEQILICGDYDVDGITSSAMMMICL